MAEENMAPEWVFDNKQATEYLDKKTLHANDINDILKMSSNISDEEIVMEKEKVEKCASSNSAYYYNAAWPTQIKSELKEYAAICNMDMSKFKAINPTDFADKVVTAKDETKMTKTASTTLVLSDPFKLDEKLAGGHTKTKWHPELKNASKLEDKPAMNGIVPVRGGEDYFANSESKVAKNQNSISDPNAIDRMAKSEVEDTGARLRRENLEKENAKKTKHEEWQKEKIEAMAGKDILPNRYVFPTECLNAQPGIRGEVFDYSKLPEKTAGEQIKEQNNERREQIQGKEKGKYEFNIAKSPTRSISEDFSSELAKYLK